MLKGSVLFELVLAQLDPEQLRSAAIKAWLERQACRSWQSCGRCSRAGAE